MEKMKPILILTVGAGAAYFLWKKIHGIAGIAAAAVAGYAAYHFYKKEV